MFAAWSLRVEATPGPLAATADALARSSTIVEPRRGPRPKMPSAAGTAYLLLAASRPGPAAYVAVFKALGSLAKAVHDMHRADAAARRAREVQTILAGDLLTIRRRLDALQTNRTPAPVPAGPSGPAKPERDLGTRPSVGPRQTPGARPDRPGRGGVER